ncbi:D-alanyl-D-alanine carboxypeptidase/D-alanyl-D-alanine-endopeptidase [Corynebacterium godavarianum]|uniref:D-alanyl-D-alanine carboxypeptidase/D-alanyl-D-alanine-endopeptidase n=1 Tax=Corynebacterium godavarianum TaxID=2054421 RepID=A0ABY3E0F4_9CORY|nr:D-alanyl-D-alanine carboxypeptidase/D-alanyl-D-alanine-endopeptidase [Corynebacterium godavarianum]MBL7286676.1 D-alanyl-D-alanine carboxypeptidase/D-alanyl-D-alanine-endopeptidase [Corynebacterium godavarianum]TSJ73087.1 D-alanyl-D-alanine carboxypeptidase/D-alanyl-D-alanine-endopeptidase [Corynebacterium godavarianum]
MKVWTWVVGALALGAVGTVAGFGVAAQRDLASLEHAPAYALQAPPGLLTPAEGSPVDEQLLIDALSSPAANPDLGTFHARISNAATGEVVFDQHADEPLRPASVTKILTAAAALYQLGPEDTLSTAVVRGANPGEVTILAGGDVWLDDEALDALAAQVSNVGGAVDTVTIDTSSWDGMEEYPESWDPENVDAGFVAPMQPAMLSGGRLGGATEGDVPRTHTPALDVAQALANRLGAANVAVADGPAPADAEVVASVESPTLLERMRVMMRNSDNVYAEAIGRELALARGTTDAPQAALDTLAEQGFDVSGTTLLDNCGLSDANRIPPALLDGVLLSSATEAPIRDLLGTLPVAAGEGTLASRYGDLAGRGWVRAKTGTLDETSALAGTVTSVNGNVYTFAFISNDSSILEARRGMDQLASVLRDF